jgi:DNA-binding NarL/FixJ family response regulator
VVEYTCFMRVLIADPSAKIRQAMHIFLADLPAVTIIGEIDEGQNLLFQARQMRPDLMVLNRDLAGLPMNNLLFALKKLEPPPKIIIFSRISDGESAARLAGADAFVSIFDPPEQLLACINAFLNSKKLN